MYALQEIVEKIKNNQKVKLGIVVPGGKKEKASGDLLNETHFGQVKDKYEIVYMEKVPMSIDYNKELEKFFQETLSNWHDIDLLIIVRGGGEDVKVFSLLGTIYEYVKALEKIKKPAIVGLGHLDDKVRLEDYVDCVCDTPTDVSVFLNELATLSWEELLQKRQKHLKTVEEVQENFAKFNRYIMGLVAQKLQEEKQNKQPAVQKQNIAQKSKVIDAKVINNKAKDPEKIKREQERKALRRYKERTKWVVSIIALLIVGVYFFGFTKTGLEIVENFYHVCIYKHRREINDFLFKFAIIYIGFAIIYHVVDFTLAILSLFLPGKEYYEEVEDKHIIRRMQARSVFFSMVILIILALGIYLQNISLLIGLWIFSIFTHCVVFQEINIKD